MATIASPYPFRTYRCTGGHEEFLTGRCLHCQGDYKKQCSTIGPNVLAPGDGTFKNEYFHMTTDKAPFHRNSPFILMIHWFQDCSFFQFITIMFS